MKTNVTQNTRKLNNGININLSKDLTVLDVPKSVQPFNKDKLTEQEVNLLKRRLNDKKITFKELNEIKLYYDREGWSLTDEQNQKGLEYLKDKWKTSSGIERKNNPFGFRETEILDNFREIKLIDFYNASRNRNFDFYIPVYEVISKDGNSFEYHLQDGIINIVG